MTIRDRLQASLGNAYTLERELVGGGMAQVFLANEQALGRRVVVKMLPEDLVGSVNLDRFSREIQVVAHLQHPCILPVLSAGIADGVPYYTMPFVDGKSLQDRLADGGELSLPEALKALRDLASGLAYAHDHGIVHRDIKPGNILLSDGYALITDFGVAKALSASVAERLTATGIAIGTPSYMSPEQASGDPHVDQRADIYAFGCVAYEMLVGQPPFAGRALQAVTAAHLTETPDQVTTHRPSVPAPLSRLIARCLEKRPADRPQSARELVQELDAIATPPGGATAALAGAALGRGLTSRATLAGGLIAIAAVAGLGVIVARRDRGRAGDAGTVPHRVVVRTFRNTSGDKALDPIGLMAADWIARGLTETPAVDVAGTESEIASRETAGPSLAAMSPTMLGRLVRARYVISGSYYKQGDSLFLQADVTDADSGRRVLTVPPVGDKTEAKQAALEQLRQVVTGKLVPFFDSSIVTETRVPPRYEAYEEFLIGDRLWNRDMPGSMAHLRTAARLDSTFVWPRLRVIPLLHLAGLRAATDSLIAEVEAMRSRLTPYEAAAFEARIAVTRDDFDALYVAATNARRLAPRSTWAAYEASEAALIDGRPGETVRLLEALDPESGALRYEVWYYNGLCAGYYALDRVPDLRRCYERARRQHPGETDPLLLSLGGHAAEGDVEGVERMVDSVIAVPGHFLVGALFMLEAHGHADGARAIAQRALGRTLQPAVDSTRASTLLDTRMNLLMFLGEWRELLRLADSTLQQGRSPSAFALRGVAAGMLGDSADARARAAAVAAYASGERTLDAARILAAVGDKRAALHALQHLPAPAYYWQYHNDLIYRLMRGYAPFEEYLKPRD
jgi:tRNA A-37 threonylcarbamoyl transferase component Bud32/TolB-like protein